MSFMSRAFLIPCLLVGSLCLGSAYGQEDAAPKAKPKAKSRSKSVAAAVEDRARLVTDGELAQWLVRVLGLSRFLPAAPTDLECFQILMQNNILPADGWQKDRTVTMGALARVVVQGLGRQSEVQNPQDDASWVNFLKEIGIDFGTIGEAVENLEPLPQPVGPEAVITSTVPLGKLQRINPPDNPQHGSDLSTSGRLFSQTPLEGRTTSDPATLNPVTEEELENIPELPIDPGTPPPMTPN